MGDVDVATPDSHSGNWRLETQKAKHRQNGGHPNSPSPYSAGVSSSCPIPLNPWEFLGRASRPLRAVDVVTMGWPDVSKQPGKPGSL
jgi:hypothetical protein